MSKRRTSDELYQAARTARDLEAVASGNPRRIARRSVRVSPSAFDRVPLSPATRRVVLAVGACVAASGAVVDVGAALGPQGAGPV